ncbi:hypothetical protein D3C75_1077880 [compost metagenome]
MGAQGDVVYRQANDLTGQQLTLEHRHGAKRQGIAVLDEFHDLHGHVDFDCRYEITIHGIVGAGASQGCREHLAGQTQGNPRGHPRVVEGLRQGH